MENFDTHLYQFNVWKKSMKARFIFEGLFVILVALLFQYYLIDAIVASSTVATTYTTFEVTATNAGYTVSSRLLRNLMFESIINIDVPSTSSTPSTPSLPTGSPSLPIINGSPFNGDFSTLPTSSPTYVTYSNFVGRAYDFYVAMMITVYLGFVAVSFSFRIPLFLAFSKKSKRPFELFTINNILDMLLSIWFILRIYLEFKYYHNDVESQPNDSKMGERYYKNIYNVYNADNFLSYLYSFISAWIWLRIILLLRLTRFLGPLIKMIQNMIYDIMIFMVLYGIQLLFFASIGNLLFNSVSNYSSFKSSLKILFEASLGSFSFSTLNGNSKGKVIGDTFIFLFVLFNAIILLNLLIAILTNTYSLLENKKLAWYINEILKLRSTLEYDEYCSSLVSAFAPWNIFAVFFIIPIVFKKNSQKFNTVLFHIEYIPLLVLLFILYLVLNLILLPFAYLKGCLIQLQWLKNKKIETHFLRRLLSLIISLSQWLKKIHYFYNKLTQTDRDNFAIY